MRRVFRIQDADGRGPYKPGFSALWCDQYGNPPPPTWIEEFPGLLRRMNEEAHYGAGCRSIGQLAKWFTPTELARLYVRGYRLVEMEVDRVLAESKNQLVFKRTKPLNVDIKIHGLFEAQPDRPLPPSHAEPRDVVHAPHTGTPDCAGLAISREVTT